MDISKLYMNLELHVYSQIPPVTSVMSEICFCVIWLNRPFEVSDLVVIESKQLKTQWENPEGHRLIFTSLLPTLPDKYSTKPDQNMSTLVCVRRKCLDTGGHFFFICLKSKLLWDTQHDNAHKLTPRKQTNRCHPTDKHSQTYTHRQTHTHLITAVGGGFWSCDKLSSQRKLSMESFSVPLFDAVLVINSDKSSSSSLLMCTQHTHTRTHTHKHTFQIYPPLINRECGDT